VGWWEGGEGMGTSRKQKSERINNGLQLTRINCIHSHGTELEVTFVEAL